MAIGDWPAGKMEEVDWLDGLSRGDSARGKVK